MDETSFEPIARSNTNRDFPIENLPVTKKSLSKNNTVKVFGGILILLVFAVIIILSLRWQNNELAETTQDNRTQASQDDDSDYFNFWPMQMGSWWLYKQRPGFESKVGWNGENSNDPKCSPSARAAYYIQPPDLTARGISSRTVVNYKTDGCIYNWVGGDYEIRWKVGYPQDSFNTANGVLSIWWRQWGIDKFISNLSAGGLISTNDKLYNLPFNKNGKFKKNSRFADGELRVKTVGSQEPYSFFPYSASATGKLLDVSSFGGCSTKNYKAALGLDFSDCTAQGKTSMWWETYSEIVDFDPTGINIPQNINTALKVTYVEIGLPEGKNKNNIKPEEVGWVACEDWYYVPNIGPVRIDSTNWQWRHPGQPSTKFNSAIDIVDTCKNFDFNSPSKNNRPNLDPKHLLFVTSLILEDKNINGNPQADYGYDSPDAVSYFGPYNGVMYIKNGWWWTYNLNTGLLASTGKLIDAWGDKVKNMGVKINGQTKFPYSTGGPIALAWAPKFIQNVVKSPGGQQIIFNQGGYWIWKGGENPWSTYGETKDLLSNAPGYNLNGKTIYPWTDGGPDAADGTQDDSSLILVNKGIVWNWSKNGFSNPSLIMNNTYFKKAPIIAGKQPFQPQAIAQFTDGQYLSSGVPTPYQQVLYQDGRVWVNYNGVDWQKNNKNYTTSISARSLSRRQLSEFLPISASPSPTPTPPPTPTSTPGSLPPIGGTNLLANGDFTSGLTKWNYAVGNTAQVTTEAGTAKISITNPSGNMQLMQLGTRLEANKTYRVSFDAKSNNGRGINAIQVLRNSAPYTMYGSVGGPSSLPTNQLQNYSYTFTTSGFSGATTDTRFRFWLVGAPSGTIYWIDNVKLEKTD